jgi:recombinational DNA repair ATPase RecF
MKLNRWITPFFIEYIDSWENYKTLLTDYNDEVLRYNNAIKGKTFIVGSEEYTAMKTWEAEIIAMGQTIVLLEKELGDYYYLPSGIVSNYTIYW